MNIWQGMRDRWQHDAPRNSPIGATLPMLNWEAPMPKFSVTTDDGHGLINERVEFPTEKAATDDAQVSLVDAAREKLPNGSHADFRI